MPGGLNKLDTASQWGHGWLAQATELPIKSLLCPMRAASLPCPHWRPFFANFSRTPWVTQYFLVNARKVNSFAAILLVSSSQLPFPG